MRLASVFDSVDKMARTFRGGALKPQLPGDGDHRTMLSIFSSPFSELQPETSQVTSRAKRSKDILGTSNQ
jgi:hypothetical protein